MERVIEFPKPSSPSNEPQTLWPIGARKILNIADWTLKAIPHEPTDVDPCPFCAA